MWWIGAAWAQTVSTCTALGGETTLQWWTLADRQALEDKQAAIELRAPEKLTGLYSVDVVHEPSGPELLVVVKTGGGQEVLRASGWNFVPLPLFGYYNGLHIYAIDAKAGTRCEWVVTEVEGKVVLTLQPPQVPPATPVP